MEVGGDVDTAIASYRKVAALKPQVPEVHDNLGVALKRKGDLEPAIESFSRALELKPDFAQAASNRGWAYVEQGNWRAANADFEKALALQPDDEGALYGLARGPQGVARLFRGPGRLGPVEPPVWKFRLLARMGHGRYRTLLLGFPVAGFGFVLPLPVQGEEKGEGRWLKLQNARARPYWP